MLTARRWITMAALAAALTAAGTVTLTGAASAESNGGVRVMPLGDSITEGTQVPGGYRIGLWQRLAAGGYRVDFVGSQFNGPASPRRPRPRGPPRLADRPDRRQHRRLAAARTTPRTVLLHIGTNDVLQNYNVANAPARLSTLIDHITATAPAAEVFVASIIPLANAGQESRPARSTPRSPASCRARSTPASTCTSSTCTPRSRTADLTDGIHPTAGGYDKMAATWYTALRSVPGSIGDPANPGTGTTLVERRVRALPRRAEQQHHQRRRSRSSGTAAAPPTSAGQSTARPCSRWASASTSPTGATAGTQGADLGLQRRHQPAVELQRQRHHQQRRSRACASTSTATPPPTAPPCILWTCTAAANQRWTRACRQPFGATALRDTFRSHYGAEACAAPSGPRPCCASSPLFAPSRPGRQPDRADHLHRRPGAAGATTAGSTSTPDTTRTARPTSP